MAGGNTVTITGTGFTGLSGSGAVLFTALPATSYVVVNSTTITGVVPAQSAGLYNIQSPPLEGRGNTFSGDHYTYDRGPVDHLDLPNVGPPQVAAQ